jgi:cytochrome c553
MKLLCTFATLVIAMALTGVAHAQTRPSQVAWDLKTVNFIKSGQAERGKALHAACVDCHGATGVSPSPDFPDLAGQDPLYTYKQLHDYKSGVRVNPLMQGYVAGLSERDMADLAQFYARQKRGGGNATPVPDAGAMALVKLGDGGRMLVACVYCHGVGGSGNPGMYGMPALEGQNGAYLQQTLHAFASGERHNDVYRAMRDVARRLSPTEIAWLASYYSGTTVAPLAAKPASASSAPAPAPAVASAPVAAAAPAPATAASTAGSGAGWYTAVQAERGGKLYAAQCAMCHGAALGGGMGPALAGRSFWTQWGGKPFAVAWKEVHAKMPMQAPGSDAPAVSIDILAFLLSRNGVPAGSAELNDRADLARALPAR